MRRRACVAEFSRKDGTVRLGRDLCASAEKSTIASVLQAASSIFCLARARRGAAPYHARWWLTCWRYRQRAARCVSSRTQRGVPAAVGATTARASSRRRRSDASEQDSRANASTNVAKRSAVAWPIPRPAPVITATLSFSPRISLPLLSFLSATNDRSFVRGGSPIGATLSISKDGFLRGRQRGARSIQRLPSWARATR